MNRNRLILTLLINDGLLVNSCQFCLNNMCEVETLLTYLDYNSIDELVILNVTRGKKNKKHFLNCVEKITQKCFLPVSVGGGIETIEDCYDILNSGADKAVINSCAVKNMNFISQLSNTFGKQFVVCSIDAKIKNKNEYKTYFENGSKDTDIDVIDLIKLYEEKGAGEIYLRSMDMDGTQQGFDLDLIKMASDSTSLPIISAGGVGDYEDLAKGIEAGAMAVSIGNLFHFVGISLVKAREFMKSDGINIPESKWNFSTRHGELN